ncbi:MAG TPA: hypothetical protein VMM12_07555, partial [Longimicrobiales bacterium]|nr:hypothetical protein [Longimicrobiales bacterium]
AERLGTTELELADRLDRLARRGIVEFKETLESPDALTDIYRFPDRARMEAWRDVPEAGS